MFRSYYASSILSPFFKKTYAFLPPAVVPMRLVPRVITRLRGMASRVTLRTDTLYISLTAAAIIFLLALGATLNTYAPASARYAPFSVTRGEISMCPECLFILFDCRLLAEHRYRIFGRGNNKILGREYGERVEVARLFDGNVAEVAERLDG